MWEGRTQDGYLRRYEMQHDGGVFAEHQYSGETRGDEDFGGPGEKNLGEFDNALNPRVKIADWSRCPTLDISGLKVAWAMGVSTPDVYTIVWKFASSLDYHTA